MTNLQIGLIVSGGLLALSCCLCAGVLAVNAPPQTSRPTPSRKQEDPYTPDCAIIRKWLATNYGGGVEVTSWGTRTINRTGGLGDSVVLSARFRVKGDRGTKEGIFIIGPGDVVESASVSD
jgi:hypothetical protein